jgi:hypothetical protein
MKPATLPKLMQAVGAALWAGISAGYVINGIVGVVHISLIPLPDAVMYGVTFSIAFLVSTLVFWIVVARSAVD